MKPCAEHLISTEWRPIVWIIAERILHPQAVCLDSSRERRLSLVLLIETQHGKEVGWTWEVRNEQTNEQAQTCLPLVGRDPSGNRLVFLENQAS